MSLLLCFAGQIGSGKSSVSTAVAAALGWQRTGFGDYLRAEVGRAGGDPNDRESLQDLGQRLVEADPAAFCSAVLTAGGFRPSDDFVVDGVRHVSIFDLLVKLGAPSEAKLLFLGAEDSTRLERVATRADARDFARATGHRVESDLQIALPDRAHGAVDANQSLDRVVADCLALVDSWRGD